MRITAIIFFCVLSVNAISQSLKVAGKYIVDKNNNEIILRGMGLGGWMLQEPYMLKLSGVATSQHDIRNKIASLIGEENTKRFYKTWLENHCTKADIDSLAAWGFNSVRLPMHYNLYTLPIELEPVKGKQTWIENGFIMTDSLLAWCKANKMYLILDLHAAPGGQGNDNAISDRDTSKPTLWESPLNKEKTIALWQKLAKRYAKEEWIGGYDLINEPNWGFTDPKDKNGCNEKENKPLRDLLIAITKAIRKEDKQHIIFLEANCWANNYDGIFPLWDNNLVISFHKYWNYTDEASIKKFLDYRATYNVPIWMGETGENSNAWFTNVISLFERNKIGWAMWPLKKSGINNPVQVKINIGTQNIIDYWKGNAVKPNSEEAFKSLSQYALNTNIANSIIRNDVIDAMFRQVNKPAEVAFTDNNIKDGKVIYATDYDMGRSGYSYHDKDSAEYWVSTNKRTGWNSGGVYRNDGVDIEACADVITNGYNVGWIQEGEWLQYTLYSAEDTQYDVDIRSSSKDSTGRLKIIINSAEKIVTLPVTGDNQKWQSTSVKNIPVRKGLNKVRLYAIDGGYNLNYIQFKNSLVK